MCKVVAPDIRQETTRSRCGIRDRAVSIDMAGMAREADEMRLPDVVQHTAFDPKGLPAIGGPSLGNGDSAAVCNVIQLYLPDWVQEIFGLGISGLRVVFAGACGADG